MWIRETPLRAAVAFGFTMASMFMAFALLYLGPEGPLAIRHAALIWAGSWIAFAFFFYRAIKPLALARELDEQAERGTKSSSERVSTTMVADAEGINPRHRRSAFSHLPDRVLFWLIVASGLSGVSWVLDLMTGSQSRWSATVALVLSIGTGSALLVERRRRHAAANF